MRNILKENIYYFEENKSNYPILHVVKEKDVNGYWNNKKDLDFNILENVLFIYGNYELFDGYDVSKISTIEEKLNELNNYNYENIKHEESDLYEYIKNKNIELYNTIKDLDKDYLIVNCTYNYGFAQVVINHEYNIVKEIL